MDNSDIIRKFERFVFHGVPERPESTYQKNIHGIYDTRLTGESGKSNFIRHEDLDDSLLIGFVKDDFTKEVQTFVPVQRSEN